MSYKKIVLAIIFLTNHTVWSIKAPIGLPNYGNACYMNSIFQIFFSAQDLIDSIGTAQAPTASKQCPAESIKLLQTFQSTAKLYFEAMQKNQASLPTGDIRPLIQALEKCLLSRSYFQQNAILAFRTFLDGLCDCSPAIVKLFNCGRYEVIDQCERAASPGYQDITIYEAKGVALTVGYESKLNYSSLQDALAAYIKPQKRPYHNIGNVWRQDGSNLSACNQTNIIARSSRYMLIFLNLDRYDPNNMPHIVRIPQFLDMSKFILNNPPAHYRLTGAALHNGDWDAEENGRYTACVRRDNDWFYCDDLKITKLGQLSPEGALEDLLKKMSIDTAQRKSVPVSAVFTPYVLLYEKIGQAEQQVVASTKDVARLAQALQQLERALA